jgi:hypothetical protein
MIHHNKQMDTPCKRLAEALHGACVALSDVRYAGSATAWADKVGVHVALAISALPDAVLRSWLLDGQTVGGEEVYRTLKAGADVRANGGKQHAA